LAQLTELIVVQVIEVLAGFAPKLALHPNFDAAARFSSPRQALLVHRQRDWGEGRERMRLFTRRYSGRRMSRGSRPELTSERKGEFLTRGAIQINSRVLFPDSLGVPRQKLRQQCDQSWSDFQHTPPPSYSFPSFGSADKYERIGISEINGKADVVHTQQNRRDRPICDIRIES
jgi:hypothetical protein